MCCVGCKPTPVSPNLLCCPCLPVMAGQMQAKDTQGEEEVIVVQPETRDEPADLKQAVLGEPIIGMDPKCL